jgi:tetraacyldisaccharide 4'-kinase
LAGYNHDTLKNTLFSIARRLQAGWEQPRLVNRLALPLSWLYCLLATLHRLSWRTPLRRPRRVGAPLVVVGNVTTGGTGKTPLVLALAGHFQRIGKTPGIISRGYGGTSGPGPQLVTAADSAAEVGDEPLLLQRRSGLPVAVCAERFLAARLLVEKAGCDVIISDDGMQHHRLHRDVDVVVIDGIHGLGNGWCLPAGPLREPASALRRADFVVYNGVCGKPVEGHGDSTTYRMSMAADQLQDLGEPSRRMPLASLSGRVHAVAGLGNPERFFRALEESGLDIIRHPFPDHHPYAEADFSFADETSVIVMTEKDAVKCASLDIPGAVRVLPVTARLDDAFFQGLEARLGFPAAEPGSY